MNITTSPQTNALD